MNYYITNQQEEKLLNLEYKTNKLGLREKKSISRLQIVSHKGVKALKSIEDPCQKFRIVIATVLTKIFFSFNSDNEARLNLLKDIIYSSSLKLIVTQKGIQREHLLKSVAENLNKMKVGLDSEAQVMRLFNTVPFFDETIMRVFSEYQPDLMSQDSNIEEWLWRDLGIKLNLEGGTQVMNQTNDEILLIGLKEEFRPSKGCYEYLRYSMQNAALLDEDADQPRRNTMQLVSFPQSPEDIHTNRNSDQNQYLMMSIESVSPTVKFLGDSLSRKKRTILTDEKQAEDDFNPLRYDMRKGNPKETPSQFSARSSDRIVRMKRKKENSSQNSGIWKFLCCSFSKEQ